MKKTQKKIFGLLGLFLVAVTTFFAASLPSPEASAVSGVTDTIVVRVVEDKTDVNITNPKTGEVFIDANQEINYNYTDSETVEITITYTDMHDTSQSYTYNIPTVEGYDEGMISFKHFIEEQGYGFGKYVVKIVGKGSLYDEDDEGEDRPGYDEDSISFQYIPVIAAIDDDGEGEGEDETDGGVYVDLYYDKTDEKIKKLVIEVYKDGKLVKELSPIVAIPGEDRKELDFDGNNLGDGKYVIKVTAYGGEDGETQLYFPYILEYDYKGIKTPDTGTIFNNLRISKADYLATGLIIFFLVGVSGLYFVSKNKSGTRKKK